MHSPIQATRIPCPPGASLGWSVSGCRGGAPRPFLPSAAGKGEVPGKIKPGACRRPGRDAGAEAPGLSANQRDRSGGGPAVATRLELEVDLLAIGDPGQ